jgi:HAMP domain-containing protein
MGIGAKILVSILSTCLALVLLLGTVTFLRLGQIRSAAQLTRISAQIRDAVLNLRTYEQDYQTHPTPERQRKIQRELGVLAQHVAWGLEAAVTEDQRRSFQAMQEEIGRCQKYMKTWVQASPDVASYSFIQLGKAQDRLRHRASTMETQGHEAIDQATGQAKSGVTLSIVVIFALGTLLGLRVAVGISEPVKRMVRMAHRIAEGDLQQRLPVSSRDEIGELAMAFNQMTEKLQEAEEWRRLSTMSRHLVADIIRDLGQKIEYSESAMMEAGRNFCQRIEGPLENFLLTFEAQGLGTLRLESIDPERGEIWFVGLRLFESTKPSDYPCDHFTRGFLAQAITSLVGVPMHCEETLCQAQGATCCRFLVYPARRDEIPDLRVLEKGHLTTFAPGSLI